MAVAAAYCCAYDMPAEDFPFDVCSPDLFRLLRIMNGGCTGC